MATRIYRTEATVERVLSVVPAANTTFIINLPAGAYRIAVTTNSNVTGTTTRFDLTPFANKAQTLTTVNGLRNIEPNDTVVAATFTFGEGAENRYATYVNSAFTTSPHPILALPFGVQLSFVKGTAVTDELLEIELIAVRVQ